MGNNWGWTAGVLAALLAVSVGASAKAHQAGAEDEAGRGSSGRKADEPPALRVPYPAGYRNWPHVKTELIHDAKHPLFQAMGGFHHIYANPTAVKALRGNRKFPTGAVLVLDLLDFEDRQGSFVEVGRKFVGVMVRDAQRYKSTNGWGWQAWEAGDPKKPVLRSVTEQKACASCHTQAVSKGFTFSDWAE